MLGVQAHGLKATSSQAVRSKVLLGGEPEAEAKQVCQGCTPSRMLTDRKAGLQVSAPHLPGTQAGENSARHAVKRPEATLRSKMAEADVTEKINRKQE